MDIIHSTSRRVAVISGYTLLVMAVAAMFVTLFVHNEYIIPDNITETVENIKTSPFLWKLGILCFLIVVICDIVVTWSLYIFFKPISPNLSLLTACFRLLYTSVLIMAIMNHVKVFILLNELGDLDIIPSQILFYIRAFNLEWAIGLILFGIHLLLLGYLVLRSKSIPRLLAVVLIVAGLSYIVNNLLVFLLPNYESYKATFEILLGLPMAMGELALAFWLLIKGGKNEK